MTAPRHIMACLLLLLASCSLPPVADASAVQSEPLLDVSLTDETAVSMTPYFSVLSDASRSLTLADVQTNEVAKRFKGGLPANGEINFGHTDAVYWLRFHIHNSSDLHLTRFLELANPWLSEITLYQPSTEGNYLAVQTGSVLPFASRPYRNRHFVFPISLAAHADMVLYLRIASLNVVVPARLWTPESFHVYERQSYMAQGWYFGIVLAMILFNLFLCVMLRDSLYLLYIGAAACIALVVAEQHGLAAEFLWPASPPWTVNALPVLGLFSITAYLLFMRRMLATDISLPRLDRLLKYCAGMCAAYPLALALAPATFIKAGAVLTLCMIMLMVAVSVYSAYKRQRSAYYFVLALTSLGSGALLTVLNFYGLIHTGYLTAYFIQIGSAMEMLLLAFALADRFNAIRRQAMRDVCDANASLEGRLKMRETELNTIHQRLRAAEQRTLLSAERQRMTQDMHDGLGSSLVSALRAVEKGKLDGHAVSDVLRNCIDDLKLAIDSMEVVDADLLLLLATLRFRLAPRLASAGITLSWEISEVPALDWLTPGNSLHILRILQEAFSNILKHAQASEIRVATLVDSHGVTVSVANNGKAFDLNSALQQGGKGLRNQMRRAQSIGGTISYESNASVTIMRLLLPLQLSESAVTLLPVQV